MILSSLAASSYPKTSPDAAHLAGGRLSGVSRKRLSGHARRSLFRAHETPRQTETGECGIERGRGEGAGHDRMMPAPRRTVMGNGHG